MSVSESVSNRGFTNVSAISRLDKLCEGSGYEAAWLGILPFMGCISKWGGLKREQWRGAKPAENY